MKILLRRNGQSGSNKPTDVLQGEPIWYKDDLFIGSVGSELGGSGNPGNLVLIGGATINNKLSEVYSKSHTHGNITLSTNAQTYATIGSTNYTISLPSTDPYTTPREPASHSLNSHSDVTISSPSTKELLYYTNSKWVNGTFIDIFGGTPLTSVGSLNTNNTSAQTTSDSEPFTGTINLHKVSKTGNYSDLLNKPTIPTVNNATLTVRGTGLLGGSDTFTANASTNKTISISHNSRTETSATASGSISNDSNTFTTKEYEFDAAGHESKVTTKTWTITFPTAADLGLSNAMHFKGVLTSLPTPATTDSYSNGDVILVDKKEYVRSGKTASVAGTWVELGDEGSYALKTVSVTGTGALSGGGSLDSNRIITHNNSGVTEGSYGPSANATPNHSDTFNVPYVTVDKYGHVTAASTKTITLPAQYSHPTEGANDSAGPQNGATLAHGGTFNVPFVTVDDYGHVTEALTKTFTLPNLPTTMAPSSHTHGNVTNEGTLKDTATAPASGDKIVIRDALDNKIQTSNIEASNVSSLVTNLYNKTAGGTTQPIYFKNGAPTAFVDTVGGVANPVYMNAGTITACSSNIGSSSQPVYMNAGTITACETIDGGTF